MVIENANTTKLYHSKFQVSKNSCLRRPFSRRHSSSESGKACKKENVEVYSKIIKALIYIPYLQGT
jgi:hypothetical protein